jgi:dihydroneopterin aldolase
VRLELRGLRLVASVGVLPEERERPQPVEVDLDVDVDTEAASASDDLADAVDYAAVLDAVSDALGAGHVELLERAAGLVADAVLAVDRRVSAVDVAVRKLRPPVPHDLATAGVRLRRTRSR